MNIKTRILLAVFLLELAGYGLLLIYSHDTSRDALVDIRERQIRATVIDNYHRINALTDLMERKAIELAEVGTLMHTMAQQQAPTALDTAIQEYLKSVFTQFPESIGGGLWYEPYQFDPQRRLYGPYVFWNAKREVEFTWDLNSDEYNYPSQEWYLTALPTTWPRDQARERRSYWTAPYWDEAGSKELMMTVDSLMYSQAGAIIGLATVDWSLKEMTQFTEANHITSNAESFIIDSQSDFILSNSLLPKSVMTRYEQLPWMQQLNIDYLEKGALNVSSNVSVNGEVYELYFLKSATGLVYGVLIPQAEFYLEIDEAMQSIMLNGIVMIVFFIACMLIALELLLKPFHSVTKIIRDSIQTSDDDRITIKPIEYDQKNEFSAVVDALNIVYHQINRYTDELDQANKAKTTFLATMSHEIRTPMNAILGYAQILTSDADIPDSHQDTLKAIEGAGKHLLSLLNDVLDITKIESGGMILYYENVYVRDMIESLDKVFSVRCQQKKLDWSSEIDIPEEYIACVDRAKLNQIAFNLLGNSVKFTEHGRVHLEAAIENDHLILTIIDTGPGITPENQQKLFTPFYQGQAGFEQGGTGLGLAIIQKLVELMGGTVGLKDTSALGSIFEVDIPLNGPNPDLAPAKRAVNDGSADYSKFELTALIVDDVSINRDILAKVLERVGVRTMQAPDGLEALNILKSVVPDMLFVDIQMPIMDGLELLENLKEKYPQYLPYTCAISANINSHNNDLVKSGFAFAVSKPFQLKEIGDIVDFIVQDQFGNYTTLDDL